MNREMLRLSAAFIFIAVFAPVALSAQTDTVIVLEPFGGFGIGGQSYFATDGGQEFGMTDFAALPEWGIRLSTIDWYGERGLLGLTLQIGGSYVALGETPDLSGYSFTRWYDLNMMGAALMVSYSLSSDEFLQVRVLGGAYCNFPIAPEYLGTGTGLNPDPVPEGEIGLDLGVRLELSLIGAFQTYGGRPELVGMSLNIFLQMALTDMAARDAESLGYWVIGCSVGFPVFF